MTQTTAPEHCPLCSERLAEPTLDALEQHLPACVATETKPKPPSSSSGGKPPRRQRK